MRFGSEKCDPENVGLNKARDFLKPIKKKYSEISYADLWILASYVAIEHTGGPKIDFVQGRIDAPDGSFCPFGDGKFNPNMSRLPSPDLGKSISATNSCPIKVTEQPTIDGMRSTFNRMGLNDREITALLCGGHLYGRCHPDKTGYAGAWVSEPTKFSNEYASDLIGDKWIEITHQSK